MMRLPAGSDPITIGSELLGRATLFTHEKASLVVLAGSFRPGLFRPDFRVGRFGLIYPTPPQFYNKNETARNDVLFYDVSYKGW